MINELRNCAFSATLIMLFYRLMMAMESAAMHALFISGLPKLPCASQWTLPVPPGEAYNLLDINDLATQPESAFWHQTCSVNGGIECFGFRLKVCVASAHSRLF
jgi:hypothetical protein